jgi:opacity protein-like surface antigen
MKSASLIAFGVAAQSVFLTFAAPVAAEEAEALSFETTGSSQSATAPGPYVRIELGTIVPELDNAYWLPPGPADPQIDFGLDGDNAGFAGIAFGYDWQNGYRADVSVLHSADIGFSGPCISASDGSDCDNPPPPGRPHADISDGSVSSTALMANLFYSPMQANGSDAAFQPYVVAGLGLARNTVDSWTRVNPTSGNPVRIFGSNTETEFAWSLGLGASWEITQANGQPVLLDMSWRYFDLGSAVGGAVADVGAGVPRQPLTFDLTGHTFSVGLRIPLP